MGCEGVQVLWLRKRWGTSEENLATEAVVFMLVSLKNMFKCPVGYFLLDKINAAMQAELIKIMLIRTAEVGVQVLSVTFDGCSVNTQSIKLLSGKDFREAHSFTHPSTGEEVFFILDPCHMVKLAWNFLADAEEISSERGPIKWAYINNLNKFQEEPGLKFVNKLSSAHIKYKNKIMNVKLAAQTLSSGVADAIEFLRKMYHPDFQGSEATETFIRMTDRIFDVLNARSPFGKGFKKPLRLRDREIWSKIFQETEEYFNGLKVAGKPITNHARKTFVIGFIMDMRSVQKLALSLLGSDLEYFLPYKQSQDHSELFFSCIRARGGWNNNPNAMQFKWAMRKLLLRNHVAASPNSNCIVREDTVNNTDACGIIEFRSSKRRILEREPHQKGLNQEMKLNDLLDLKHLSVYQDSIVNYIGGFVLRKIIKDLTCEDCVKELVVFNFHEDHTYAHPNINSYHHHSFIHQLHLKRRSQDLFR